MIAACPRCAARYRIEKEKLRPDGVRLRCAKCEAVFRVRPPEESGGAAARADEPAAEAAPTRAAAARAEAGAAPAAAPAARPHDEGEGALVMIAMPDADAGKDLEEALRGWGLRATLVSDGVEAILEIQRKLPRVAVLSAALPRMYGFQICELVKRNESLRDIGVVLVGSIHHPDRYRRPPEELYGADAYVEEPDLPDGLLPALQRLGLAVRGPRPSRREPAAERAPSAPAPRPEARPASRAAPAPVDDGLGEQRAKAERLARIIVSDIVLYNEDKFAAALSAGNVLEALTPDLAEGRALFRDRIDERVRAEKDHLAEELLRVARSRG